MRVSKLFTQFALAAAALAGADGSLFAADFVPPPPPPPPPPIIGGAAPVTVGELPGCASCESSSGIARGFGRGHHTGCDKLLAKNRPYPMLNPGGCFGYFPTQWRKWEEVCPPYAGAILPRPGEIIVPPRTGDPKSDDPRMPEPKKPETKVGARPSTLPAIPQAPPVMTSKFYP